ncbi:MAG: hypothetical protein ACOC5T_03720 [Elusimicrobiota bacterium]
MIKKFQQQSLVDFLLDIMPGLGNIKRDNIVEHGTAEALFDVWKNSNNKVSNKIYKKPNTISDNMLDKMKKEGLVKQMGDKLRITQKGSEIIKTMILGDDRSSFDGDDNITLREASSNIKSLKRNNFDKKIKKDWWQRFYETEH